MRQPASQFVAMLPTHNLSNHAPQPPRPAAAMMAVQGGSMTGFAWMAILLAMLPWMGYCAWRAWRANLSWRGTVALVGLCLAGLGVVWILTLGPVVALACSMVAFSVIWVSDWPPRRPGGADTFVKVEELKAQHLE